MKIPALWQTMVFFLAVHLMMALAIPLVHDEAYYALWAKVPSAGYYDHPPMIAWWIWAGEQIFGHNRFGVRVFSLLAVWLATPMVWRIGWLATQKRETARLAAFLFNTMLLVLVLGFTATPDAPSVFFWTAAIWALFEARHNGGPWWPATGLFLGLGVLSKFTNLFLGVGAVGWLVLTSEGRGALRKPCVWVAALLGIAVLGPFIWWNYQNGWLGLERQFGRIGSAQGHEAAGWRTMAEYVLSTFLLITPLVALGALKGMRRPSSAATLLLWASLPLILFLFYHARGASIHANWLFPVYPPISVLAAMGLDARPTRAIGWNTAGSFAIAALAFALALWPGKPVFPGNTPPNQTKGWPDLEEDLFRAMREQDARWLAVSGYGLVGQLAFRFPHVPVWGISDLKRYRFRETFPKALCEAKGLFVERAGGPGAFPAGDIFREVGEEFELVRRSAGQKVDSYRLRPVRGIKSPPGFAVCQ